jgi:predicted cation transporter
MVVLLIKEHGIESSDSLVAILLGLMYGGGLMIGGALRPSVIQGVLTISWTHWNPTLLVLVITVILMN